MYRIVLTAFLLWLQAGPPAPVSVKALAAQIAAAKSDAERDALVAANPSLATPELDRAVEQEGDSLKNRGSYSDALVTYTYLKKLAANIGDRAGVAGAIRGIGAANYYLGNYEIALDHLEQALAIRKELRDPAGIAQALGALGAIHFSMADYAEALRFSEESLQLHTASGNRRAVAEVLNNIGLIQTQLGDLDRALETESRAIALKLETGDEEGALSTYNNLANLHFDMSNFRLALEYYERVLAGYRKSQDPDLDGIANALHNIAGVHLAQRSPALAMDYLKESLKLREQMGNKERLAESYNYLAEAADQTGNHGQALRYEFKALDLRKQSKAAAGAGVCLDNIGDTYQQMGDLGKAQEYYRAAAGQFHAIGNRSWESVALAHLANVALARKDYRSASSYAASALETAPAGYGDTVRMANVSAGRAARALGDLERARAHFQAAIDSIEEVRGTVSGGPEVRARFFEDKVGTYSAMVELLVDQGETGLALSYAERARGRVLLDILSISRQLARKTLTQAETEEERRLTSSLASWNAQLLRERERDSPVQPRITSLEASRERARRNLESFQARLFAAHPELAVQRGRLPRFDLDKVGGLLDSERSALLEYVVGENRTLLFVLRRQGRLRLTVHSIPVGEAVIRNRVLALRRMMDVRALGFRKAARQLFDQLLAPAWTSLAGADDVTIVPDGPLWELPFQALETSKSRYLIEDMSIAYAPSITVLDQMRSRHGHDARAYAGTLLAMGNPLAAGRQTSDPSGSRSAVAPLPEAEREVRMLGELYGARESAVYMGAAARESRFKQEAGRYRIVHVATHGYLDDTSPMYSYVRMAESGGAGEDGLLEAREIANLDLKADLTVLSACETARGHVGAGEGVIGLAWSLFVAGSPASLVSQWKVDSASTGELMLEFHKRYRGKLRDPASRMTTANALRQASLTLMRQSRYSHPFYWAGFVVVGDGR